MFNQTLTLHNTADNTTRASLIMRLTYIEGSKTIKVRGYVFQARENLFKVYIHSALDNTSASFTYSSLTEARKEARALLVIAAQATAKKLNLL